MPKCMFFHFVLNPIKIDVHLPKVFPSPIFCECVCIGKYTNEKHYISTRLHNEMVYTKLQKIDTMGLS